MSRSVATLSMAIAALAGGCDCTPSRLPCTADSQCEATEVCFFDGFCFDRNRAGHLRPLGEECGAATPCETGDCWAGYCVGASGVPPDASPPPSDAAPGDAAGDAGATPTDGGPSACGNGACQPGLGEDCVSCGADCPACCGDGVCDPAIGESCASCDLDCGACCGDGTCDSALGESCTTCGADCGGCPLSCGDGWCDVSTENCVSCAADCPCCGAAAVPPPGIAFATSIQPLLDTECTGCHVAGGGPNGLDLTSYAGVIAGGLNGSEVAACDCANSNIWLKTGPAPPFGVRMPADGPPYLFDAQRLMICDWINQGAGSTYVPWACEGPPSCNFCGDGLCTPLAGEDCFTCMWDCPCLPGCGDGACDAAGGENCANCAGDCGACCGDGTCDSTLAETCTSCAADCPSCCGDGSCDGPGGETCASCPSECGACPDGVPPAFAGLTSATLGADGLSADLCWAPASDDTTPASGLVYDVYEAATPGGQSFTALPAQSSSPGATCVNAAGLPPGGTVCFVVRARDAAGNRDSNTVEMCVAVPSASCIDYLTMVQPIFDAECTGCHSGASAPRDLHLDSYAGVLAGGLTESGGGMGEVVACQPVLSLLYLKITMDSPPIGARMPADGPPYLTAAQTATIEQWILEGATASCAGADPCSDAMPPSFAGVSSVTAINATTAELCWTAATDDTTSPADIVYSAWTSPASGGQDFAGPSAGTSPPGATCMTIDALSPTDPYCFVVRARDGAGNSDSNTVEICLTLPAVPPGCVDYATMIQPLLDANCVRCHADPGPPKWLRLDSYEGVLAGGVKRSEVEACDTAASLLLSKVSASPPFGARMPADGPPYLTPAQIALLNQWVTNGAQLTCSEASCCGDTTDPVFAGATSATALDETTVEICWAAATDGCTPASSILYDLYERNSPGSYSFTQPPQDTVVGTTCVVRDVGPSTTLCFTVRARDRSGNRDANTTEVCATTAPSTCAIDYAELIQPILNARCTYCHRAGPNPPRFLDVSSYAGLLASGSLRSEVRACDWSGSFLSSKLSDGGSWGGGACGNRMPRDGPPWLAPSEVSLIRRWIESGARYDCSEPANCSDSTPPTFGGATSATAIDGTTIEVCWSPATDDTTPASGITYDVYESDGPGNESYSSPASYAGPAGTTCLLVPAPPDDTTCFVVRARDLRRNRDTNTTEVCATTPAECVDYATRVQFIFNARCIHCHSGSGAPMGLRFDTWANVRSDPDEVSPCDTNSSNMIDQVSACNMPRDTSTDMCSTEACLTPSQERLLRAWINEGAGAICPAPGCP